MSALLAGRFHFYLLHFASAPSLQTPTDTTFISHFLTADCSTWAGESTHLQNIQLYSSLFSYRQRGDVCVHQVFRLHHVLRLRGRRLGGDHDHGADVLRQSRRAQEVGRVLQGAWSSDCFVSFVSRAFCIIYGRVWIMQVEAARQVFHTGRKVKKSLEYCNSFHWTNEWNYDNVQGRK